MTFGSIILYVNSIARSVYFFLKAFNALKEKTRIARNRNSYKKRSVNKNCDISRRMTAIKHKTNENDDQGTVK